jgi:anaerobic magnesium-protoporphyrin IX monomethyl ester cyclase
VKNFNPHIKKVSLIFPPSTSLISWEPMVTLPMGIASLGAVIRDSGYDVSCLDTVVEAPYQMTLEGEHIGRFGLNYDQIMAWVQDERPDVVGLSCIYSNQWPSVRELTRRIKALDPDIIVVTGGTHPSFLAKRCLQDVDLDFVVLSEGEYTFRDLLDRLKQEKPYDDLDGLAFRENAGIRINPKTRLIENLDELPFPARDLFPMEKYFKVALPMAYDFKSTRNTPIFTSRGCTCRCTFCSSTNHWMNCYRVHSPEYVLSEIDHLVKDFGIREVKFQDDNLTLHRKRAREIFQGMIDRNYRLHWSTPNGIATWTLDEDMLRLMKESGCYYLILAIESGNQKVLDNLVKKPLRLEKVIEVNRIMRRLQLFRGAYFIIGFPGETRAQIQDTINFAHSLKLGYYAIFIYNPLPGSELYQTCIEKGYIREDDFFEGEGNQYFTSVIDSDEWTAAELERIIRKEWLRNYWSFYRQPFSLGRIWFNFLFFRPNFLRFVFARTARALKLQFKKLFLTPAKPVPGESSGSILRSSSATTAKDESGGSANPGGSAR